MTDGSLVEATRDQSFARLKVIGIGGGGCNAVNRMIESGLKGVDFIAVNTDVQALNNSKAPVQLKIGYELTKGLGAGADPEIGRQAAEESAEEIKQSLEGADMVFITAGMGGGTGTGGAPVVARSPKSWSSHSGCCDPPIHLRRKPRCNQAEIGVKNLRDTVDTLITIPNDRLLQVVEKRTSVLEAFRMADDVLRQGVQGIADLIMIPGLINLDFADVRTIMTDAGSALMGIGEASGEDRAVQAAKSAISSPLLEASIEGAKGVLMSITGGPDLGLFEVNEAAAVISEAADPDANIIFGAVIDDSMGDSIRITVIGTGFGDKKRRKVGFGEVEMRPFIADDLDIPAFLRKPKK